MWARTAGLLGVLVGGAAATLGCGSSDASCGTASAPDRLTVTNVAPASGASLANAGIVQTFTIAGRHLQIEPSFALAATHTAGISSPNPVHWTIALSGADTLYTSEPITWATAPAHVELNPPGLLQTSDGCVLTLPTPTFSYDVSAP